MRQYKNTKWVLSESNGCYKNIDCEPRELSRRNMKQKAIATEGRSLYNASEFCQINREDC